MAGLTLTGLQIKTLSDVVTDYNAQAASIFSDVVPVGDVVDVSPDGALGRMIGVVSPALADVWAAIQQVNDSFNPATATGISLDNIVALSGINRLPATPTRAQVVLEGDFNTVISTPPGAVYSSVTQRTFSVVNAVTLNLTAASGVGLSVVSAVDNTNYTFSYSTDAVNYINTTINSGTGSTTTSILAALKTAVDTGLSATFTTYYQAGRLFITRTDPFQTVTFTTSVNLRTDKVRKPGLVVDDIAGPYDAAASVINTIAVPINGWDSVINPSPATTGRLRETDEELRERFRNSKFVVSANILEALIDALNNVSGVTDVQVYENDTNTTNTFGVPAHSFLPIVLGGLPTDIGNAIWQNKPTGIGSVGNTTVQIADSQGFTHNISYTQAIPVPIYVSLNISSTGGIPGDAIAQIRQDLLSYAQANYFIGNPVIYSRLYTPINAVPGHQVNSFYIGTSPSPTGTVNIPIAFDHVAQFTSANINITIT